MIIKCTKQELRKLVMACNDYSNCAMCALHDFCNMEKHPELQRLYIVLDIISGHMEPLKRRLATIKDGEKDAKQACALRKALDAIPSDIPDRPGGCRYQGVI